MFDQLGLGYVLVLSSVSKCSSGDLVMGGSITSLFSDMIVMLRLSILDHIRK